MDEVLEREGYKSASRESTFEQDTEDSGFLASVLDELAMTSAEPEKRRGTLENGNDKGQVQGFLTHTRPVQLVVPRRSVHTQGNCPYIACRDA